MSDIRNTHNILDTRHIEFPKIARLMRDWIITEKLDGTNAAVQIGLFDTSRMGEDDMVLGYAEAPDGSTYGIKAQSRSTMINTKNDNFGFAKWVTENAAELILGLGLGVHFGEWWGKGINRGYGLDTKRFSLFNVSRWYTPKTEGKSFLKDAAMPAPACCDVVPVLLFNLPTTKLVEGVELLTNVMKGQSSAAAPGFTNPEGLVAYHVASGTTLKYTFDDDGVPKGIANRGK